MNSDDMLTRGGTDGASRRILETAHAAWVRMAPMRERRRRYVRYTYGDQWSDPAVGRDGRVTTEGELATVGGRRPLTNNLIRRLVKTVVGRYRLSLEESGGEGAEAQGAPDAAAKGGAWRALNEVEELDARTLEEFLISGMAVHHVWRERRSEGTGVWVEAVSPDAFFVNAVRDPRCRDMELVGRLLDLAPAEMMMRFARGDRRRALLLRKLYSSLADTGRIAPSDTLTDGGGSFFHAPAGRCRVVEVWTLECREAMRCHDPLEAAVALVAPEAADRIEALNAERRRADLPEVAVKWEVTPVWRCRMFAPDGTVLDEFDSPLPGGEPPFAVKLYPLVDGDVHSLVEDVLDQQRYVNTLITMMDRMMGTAAKGVLLFPTGCKVEGLKWQEVADLWADPGGVIPYRPYQNCEPHQVVTPMADIGARDMLQTQIKLIEDVSGVSEALMGKAAGAGVGVERYESEVRQASVAIKDLLMTFNHFTRRRNSLADALERSVRLNGV